MRRSFIVLSSHWKLHVRSATHVTEAFGSEHRSQRRSCNSYHHSNEQSSYAGNRYVSHSSQSKNSNSNSSKIRDLEEWKNLAKNLIDQPVGSFDQQNWKEADETLQYWIRHENVDDDYGMLVSFQLIDRLSKEGVLLLTFDALNEFILNWRNRCVYKHEMKQSSPLFPSKLIAQLDSWRSNCASLQPDATTYTMILEAAATYTENPSEGVLFADSLLQWIISESKTHSQIRPTNASLVAVMNAWLRSGRAESSQKIEDWIERLEHLHKEGWPDLKPEVVVYNILLSAFARSRKVDSAERLLQKMTQDSHPVKADLTSFNIVLDAYAKSSLPDKTNRAESLLAKMQALYTAGDSSLKPSVHSYTAVINSWANEGNGFRAEEVLRQLEDIYDEMGDEQLKPDVVAYNAVLTGWARAQEPQKASRLLYEMLEKGNVKPNVRSFNAVLASLAKTGKGDESQAILDTMIRLHADGVLEAKPDVVSYNTVIASWANSKRQDAWKYADNQLRLMQSANNAVKPNLRTWNTVMNCLAKAGRVDRVEQLMMDLLKKFDKKPTDKSNSKNEVAPNIRTWNTLLDACKNKGDIVRAERIFARLKAYSMKSMVEPNIITYNTILHTFVRSKRRDAGECAATFFCLLKEDNNVEPNRVSFLALIRAWINCGKVEEAETILIEMYENHVKFGTVKPDRDLFHLVLVAWGETQSPKRAEALLFKMSDLQDAHRLDINPTVGTYNRILSCWAKSNMIGAGERAESILRHMEQLANAGDGDSKPDLISYTSVINTWANSGAPDALTHIERLVFEMILKGNPNIMPENATYGAWLKAISKANDDEKIRGANEVSKSMKIHNFEPSAYVLKALKKLEARDSSGKR